MNIEKKLPSLEVQYVVLSKLQQTNAHLLESTLSWRGSLPGYDCIKLKKDDSFVYMDKHGTYFQKDAKGKAIWLETVLYADLKSYSTEQIELMRKQLIIDKVLRKSETELLTCLRSKDLYHNSDRVYPMGTYVCSGDITIYGSYKPDSNCSDIFCTLSKLKMKNHE